MKYKIYIIFYNLVFLDMGNQLLKGYTIHG
jgi:hypothetical protein